MLIKISLNPLIMVQAINKKSRLGGGIPVVVKQKINL